MRKRFLWVAITLSSATGAVLVACVSDSPASDATDGGGSGDGSTTSDSQNGNEGGSACPGAQVTCGGKCVDLTISATNCGNCSKSCFGGTCSASKCASYVVAGSPTTGTVAKIATDGTRVFWIDTTLQEVAQIGAGGGATIVLESASATHGSLQPELALANGMVAYSHDVNGTEPPSVGMAKVDVPNSGVSFLFGAGELGAVSLSTSATHVFYFDKPGTQSTLFDCTIVPNDAGSCVSPSGGGNFALSSAADDGHFFFDLVQADITPTGMYIDQIDAAISAGNPTQFSNGLQTASRLAVDSTWAYWSENDDGGTLYGIHRTLEALPSTIQTPVDIANASAFATDGANVFYWNGTSLASRPVGGGAETVITAEATKPIDIAVGGGLLAWTDGTAIHAIELP